MDDGLVYPSTENAYQAYKTLDVGLRQPFTKYTCNESRKAGQLVKLREDWEQVKIDVMRQALERKFETLGLGLLLKATEPKHLEECNDWGDRFWGTVNGVGGNNLGKLLMEIRNKINAK